MPQSKKSAPMLRQCLHCDPDTAALIGRIAATRGVTKSEVIRDLIQSGLAAQGADDKETRQAQMEAAVEAAVREVLKPYMERLAAILAKGTQMAAGSFFMSAYMFNSMLPGRDIHTLAVQARSLGAEYMKLHSSQELDDYIQKALDGIR